MAGGVSDLNNYLQGTGQLTALSWLETQHGPSHAPTWKCICKINGEPRGTGTSTHKHLAKDIAANEALKYLTGRTS
ncbi:hypothetical protein BDQ17DRAFT_860852 [Cyathus striatus]|nr:hypothetical protein BDQ17DRAFT_860852 [Cyathus striatus]